MKQGVVFCEWPIIAELSALIKHVKEEPNAPIFNALVEKLTKRKNGSLPPVSGITLLGKTTAYINSVEFLDDIFVKQNAYLTKYNDI